ncbi:uncharacterized protein [Littorina saxatilis]
MLETCRRALTAQSLRVQRVDIDVPYLPNKHEDFDQDAYTEDKAKWFQPKCSLGYQHPSVVLVERIVDKEKCVVDKVKKPKTQTGERSGAGKGAGLKGGLLSEADKTASPGVIRRLELSTGSFFEFLFSDRWEEGCLLRVLKGQLLDDVLYALTKLEKYHNVISYVTMAYIYNQDRSLQSCIKGRGDGQRTKSINNDTTKIRKVMLEFDVFYPQEGLEMDKDTLATADELEQQTLSPSGSELSPENEQRSRRGSSRPLSAKVDKRDSMSVKKEKYDVSASTIPEVEVLETSGTKEDEADDLPMKDVSSCTEVPTDKPADTPSKVSSESSSAKTSTRQLSLETAPAGVDSEGTGVSCMDAVETVNGRNTHISVTTAPAFVKTKRHLKTCSVSVGGRHESHHIHGEKGRNSPLNRKISTGAPTMLGNAIPGVVKTQNAAGMRRVSFGGARVTVKAGGESNISSRPRKSSFYVGTSTDFPPPYTPPDVNKAVRDAKTDWPSDVNRKAYEAAGDTRDSGRVSGAQQMDNIQMLSASHSEDRESHLSKDPKVDGGDNGDTSTHQPAQNGKSSDRDQPPVKCNIRGLLQPRLPHLSCLTSYHMVREPFMQRRDRQQLVFSSIVPLTSAPKADA